MPKKDIYAGSKQALQDLHANIDSSTDVGNTSETDDFLKRMESKLGDLVDENANETKGYGTEDLGTWSERHAKIKSKGYLFGQKEDKTQNEALKKLSKGKSLRLDITPKKAAPPALDVDQVLKEPPSPERKAKLRSIFADDIAAKNLELKQKKSARLQFDIRKGETDKLMASRTERKLRSATRAITKPAVPGAEEAMRSSGANDQAVRKAVLEATTKPVAAPTRELIETRGSRLNRATSAADLLNAREAAKPEAIKKITGVVKTVETLGGTPSVHKDIPGVAATFLKPEQVEKIAPSTRKVLPEAFQWNLKDVLPPKQMVEKTADRGPMRPTAIRTTTGPATPNLEEEMSKVTLGKIRPDLPAGPPEGPSKFGPKIKDTKFKEWHDSLKVIGPRNEDIVKRTGQKESNLDTLLKNFRESTPEQKESYIKQAEGGTPAQDIKIGPQPAAVKVSPEKIAKDTAAFEDFMAGKSSPTPAAKTSTPIPEGASEVKRYTEKVPLSPERELAKLNMPTKTAKAPAVPKTVAPAADLSNFNAEEEFAKLMGTESKVAKVAEGVGSAEKLAEATKKLGALGKIGKIGGAGLLIYGAISGAKAIANKLRGTDNGT